MGNLTEFIRLQDATNLGKSVIDKIANYIRYCHRRRVAEETESKEEGGWWLPWPCLQWEASWELLRAWIQHLSCEERPHHSASTAISVCSVKLSKRHQVRLVLQLYIVMMKVVGHVFYSSHRSVADRFVYTEKVLGSKPSGSTFVI